MIVQQHEECDSTPFMNMNPSASTLKGAPTAFSRLPTEATLSNETMVIRGMATAETPTAILNQSVSEQPAAPLELVLVTGNEGTRSGSLLKTKSETMGMMMTMMAAAKFASWNLATPSQDQ